MDVLVWIGMYGITFVAVYALAPLPTTALHWWVGI